MWRQGYINRFNFFNFMLDAIVKIVNICEKSGFDEDIFKMVKKLQFFT